MKQEKHTKTYVDVVKPYDWSFTNGTSLTDPTDTWGEDLLWKKAGETEFVIAPADASMHDTVEDLFIATRLSVCECNSRRGVFRDVFSFLAMAELGVLDENRQLVIDQLFEGSSRFCDLRADTMEQMALTKHGDQLPGSTYASTYLTEEGKAVLRMMCRSSWVSDLVPAVLPNFAHQTEADPGTALQAPVPLVEGEEDIGIPLDLEEASAKKAAREQWLEDERTNQYLRLGIMRMTSDGRLEYTRKWKRYSSAELQWARERTASHKAKLATT